MNFGRSYFFVDLIEAEKLLLRSFSIFLPITMLLRFFIFAMSLLAFRVCGGKINWKQLIHKIHKD